MEVSAILFRLVWRTLSPLLNFYRLFLEGPHVSDRRLDIGI